MAEASMRKDGGDSSVDSDYSKSNAESTNQSRSSKIKEDPDAAFRDGLNQQRLEGKHTNVTLECHNVRFQAHTYVLACQSNYFFKMFSASPANACSHPVVCMDGYRPDVVELVLDFFYTDVINLFKINDSDLDLLVACCRDLEVNGFESRLLKALVEELRPTNYHFALVLAKENNDPQAQARIMSFVCDNLDNLWPNDEFVILDEDNIQQILKTGAKKRSTHDVLLDGLLAWVKSDVGTREQSLTKLLSNINFDRVSKASASTLSCDSLVNSHTSLKSELTRIAKRDQDSNSECRLTSAASEISVSGLNFDMEEPTLLVVGRNDNNSGTAMTFDVRTRTWFVPCDLKLSLCHNPGIGYDNERLILVGGRDINDCKLNTVTTFRISDQVVETLPDVRLARENPLVLVYDGTVFIFGGSGRYSSDGLTHGEFLSDVNAPGWKVLPPMRVKRSSLVTACIYGNDMYITGGGSVEVERFNLKKMIWDVLPPLPEQVFIDGKVFIANAGGQVWALMYFKAREIYLFNHDAHFWEKIPLKGIPPETIKYAVGYKDTIYVLDSEARLFTLEVCSKTWFEMSRVPPKAILHPRFLGLL